MSSTDEPKSLEMRIAAIEDKLSKMSVTEDDIKSYNKVASLIAGSGAAPSATAHVGGVSTVIAHPCITFIRPITPIHIGPIIVNDCIQAGQAVPAASTGFEALGKK
jgi:hypothetical protein